MAAVRSTWKGYLRLSLVTCAVRLAPATTESGRIRFNQINRDTNNRVRIRMHDEVTGEEVARDKIAKGYEFDKGRYVLIDDDELDKIKLESTHTIDIDRFVEAQELDEGFLDTPYYLMPDGKVASEAFIVIREAMKASGRVALARVVMSARERAVAIRPVDKGLTMWTLRGAQEVRPAADYFEDIPDFQPPKEMVQLAAQIIESKLGHWDPKDYEDRYQQALTEIVEAKVHGQAAVVPQVREPQPVVDLFEALRRSVAESAAAKPPAPSKSRRKAPAAGGSEGGAEVVPMPAPKAKGRKAS